MPREVTDKEAILAALKSLELTSELFIEVNGKLKNANDLEVIVEGKVNATGKRVGPYVRLLSYDSGEAIMRQGEWGGNTFYLSVEGALDVYIDERSGEQRKISRLAPGSCFGEMAVLAGVERNATVTVPKHVTAVVLEVTRPALRLLRKLPKFGQEIDETYRAHGFGRVLEDITKITDKPVSQPVADQLRKHARYMVYGKHHVLCREGASIDKLILIKSGWIRRTRGVPFHATSPEVVMSMGEKIGVDFLGEGNCLGLEGVQQPAQWKYSATLMARTEVLEVPIQSVDPKLRSELAATFAGFSNAD